MPFLPPNQQSQSTEGTIGVNYYCLDNHTFNKHVKICLIGVIVVFIGYLLGWKVIQVQSYLSHHLSTTHMMWRVWTVIASCICQFHSYHPQLTTTIKLRQASLQAVHPPLGH